jgi:hypothetical protein
LPSAGLYIRVLYIFTVKKTVRIAEKKECTELLAKVVSVFRNNSECCKIDYLNLCT